MLFILQKITTGEGKQWLLIQMGLDSDQPKNEFGDLYAYNNKTGKLQWVIELGSRVTTSPSVSD